MQISNVRSDNAAAAGLRPPASSLFFTIVLSFLAASAAAQPPALIHYQGRLTDSSGTPVISAQTIYFSLWSGGTAAAAGSGAQLYREHAVIQPTATGIIEHDVGAGTLDAGSLKASDFGTASPIFLQVEAGSPLAPLLPRTQVTSVGYAFYAAQAGYAPQTGTPRVSSVTDKTGGDVVIGDLLQIDGDGLAGTTVTVGGRPAPIVGARTATSLTCQVPAGIPMGLNPVAILDQANSLNSVTVAHVNVHRLIVWVSRSSSGAGYPQIVIVDALTGAKKAELNVPWLIGQDTPIPRLQMAFANQGSLALVPSNDTNGVVYAINLTATPPALVQANGIYVGANRAVAAAVSADNILAVSDINGNRLRFYKINETAPPYSAALLGTLNNQIIDLGYATGFSYPRGLAFIGSALVVCATNSIEANDSIFTFRREIGTNNFRFFRPVDATAAVNNKTPIGDQPFAIQPTRDGSRIYILSLNGSNLGLAFTAPGGIHPPVSVIGAASALGVAVSPDGDTLFAADNHATGASPTRIMAFNATGGLTLVGEHEDDLLPQNADAFQLAAMEPVEGRQLAVGTNTDTLMLFSREGGSLAFQRKIQTISINRATYELQYQP